MTSFREVPCRLGFNTAGNQEHSGDRWRQRTATSLLFGLKPHDPATILVAIVGLAAVAAAASFLPAYRASRLDPMTALREE
jgi:ABC-type antimicrobial peptide transport system permease subunit